MKKTTNILIGVCIVLCLMIMAFYQGRSIAENNITGKTDTLLVSDTVYKDTTITVHKDGFIPNYIYVTKVDTFYKKDGKDTIFKTENKLYQDTLICEKDSVILASYITGQNAKLDSIKADWKKSEKIITNTVTVTRYIEKPKTFLDRIKVQPQITSGYDIINHKWGVTAGVGVGIDI